MQRIEKPLPLFSLPVLVISHRDFQTLVMNPEITKIMFCDARQAFGFLDAYDFQFSERFRKNGENYEIWKRIQIQPN